MAGRQTRGRQRIDMKRIENENDRLITFSKRRSGIYKKSNELVTLCGAQVGVAVFSPAGKPFSFAHPSIDAVANWFLNRNPPPNDRSHALVESYRRVRLNELNQRQEELINQIQAEQARNEVLKRLTEGKRDAAWWEAPIEELNREELYQMKARMEDLRRTLQKSIDQRIRGEPCASIEGQKLEK
ncbi:agamous-like MADS-box protein AGL62 [Rhodamnia argentea]|uniref:Agamous-like MADS-box protein AGL62 n=1 Tax=Rhodamnia argentea TaxID=178133 RepID=A0A8B8N8B8_9MYRT|nr:agamous-like MADS-box protein AGL62 [Rhodamnia argentea]